MRLPDFLVIGAEKGGTTWIYAALHDSPGIYLPETKEIHFFNRFTSNFEELDRYERLGLAWYERYFRDAAPDQITGEVTPMYLCDPDAPGRIRDTLPDVRLICSLRNPVDRAYSHYWMALRKGDTTDTFEEVVRRREPRFIQRGLYGSQIARYLEIFPRDRMHVAIYEELFKDTASGLATLRTFLGLDHSPPTEPGPSERVYSATAFRSAFLHKGVRRAARTMSEYPALAAVTRAAKKAGFKKLFDRVNSVPAAYPPLQPDLREELMRYYANDITLLEDLVGRRIEAWR
jgi:hypothetical protein